MSVPYYHVDAFTSTLFAGNPAGVCVLPAFPPDVTMQRIAAENRHSETAFVVARPDGDYDLRWFTPTLEDDLCGHATLAAAFVLTLRGFTSWPARFHTRSGQLTVAKRGALYELDFPAWPAQPRVPPPGLLQALGLERAQVHRARDFLVVVDTPAQVRAVTPDLTVLAALEPGQGGVIVTSPAEAPLDYGCRFFAPAIGVAEDPATGSIQCTLVPYWAARLGKPALRSQQWSSRGGEAECTLVGDRVRIRGSACLYLQGELQL